MVRGTGYGVDRYLQPPNLAPLSHEPVLPWAARLATGGGGGCARAVAAMVINRLSVLVFGVGGYKWPW
jgi:hypothetical protein